MDISEIKSKYFCGYYDADSKVNMTESTEIIPVKVKDDHVFDENLSVKRNREMVIEHNNKVDELIAKQRKKQADLNKQLNSDIIEYLIDTYDLTYNQACVVERFTYDEKHSYMYNYFDYLDTFAQFAEELLIKGAE